MGAKSKITKAGFRETMHNLVAHLIGVFDNIKYSSHFYSPGLRMTNDEICYRAYCPAAPVMISSRRSNVSTHWRGTFSSLWIGRGTGLWQIGGWAVCMGA